MPAIELYELVEPAPEGAVQNHFQTRWIHQAALALLQTPFDQAVNQILRYTGEAANADRSWMFRYNQDATLFRNTHEWSRDDVSDHGEDLQDVPVTMIAWLQHSLLARKAVMVSQIQALPRSARALRAEFERQKNQSVLSVPIFHQGKIWGCIGFDAVREQVRWNEQIARALFLCGELIAAGAERKHKTNGEISEFPPTGVLYLRGPSGKQKITTEQIIGVRAEGDYTRVHLADGDSALELRPLKIWIDLLPKEHFQRIHRGSIVNIRWVTDLEQRQGGQWTVKVHGTEEEWGVSKRYRAELRSRFGF